LELPEAGLVGGRSGVARGKRRLHQTPRAGQRENALTGLVDDLRLVADAAEKHW
jgi:hypothetical protein